MEAAFSPPLKVRGKPSRDFTHVAAGPYRDRLEWAWRGAGCPRLRGFSLIVNVDDIDERPFPDFPFVRVTYDDEGNIAKLQGLDGTVSPPK